MAKKKESEGPTRLEQIFKMREERDTGTPLNDEAFEKRFPALFYFLNEIHVEDKLAERNYIKFWNDGGDLLMQLVVPSAGVACEVCTRTHDEALQALEAKCCLGRSSWRFWTKYTAKLKPNGKEEKKE